MMRRALGFAIGFFLPAEVHLEYMFRLTMYGLHRPDWKSKPVLSPLWKFVLLREKD
jgi:hypothetical protein